MHSREMFSRKIKIPAGTTIVSEGDKEEKFYVLLNGKCAVYKHGIEFTSLDKRGIIFGEISMLLNIPRTATVKAATDVELYEVEADLDTMLTEYPKIIKSIIRTLGRHVAHTTDLLFGYILEDELDELEPDQEE